MVERARYLKFMNKIISPAKQFIFRSRSFDAKTGEVNLVYVIDDEEFVEKLKFPVPSESRVIDQAAIDAALLALHLVGGVSYYKAKLPPAIIIESGSLNKEQADFWNKLYTLGLGEFFYRNNLDFRGYVKFPINSNSPSYSPMNGGEYKGSIVPIGGGKDSLVAIEMLKTANIPFDLLMFGNHSRIKEVAVEVGQPLLSISRTIDPKLIELNAAGAWNGHVPITAYVAIASVFTALLMGKREVIFANERSANSGNAEFEGIIINHQYSKSIEAERDLQNYISAFISKDIRCFSLLRPLSELDIARRFAGSGKYFNVFSSCNKNFKQGGVPTITRWCGKCPKCAFVFVMLGAFIPRHQMVKMFDEDLLMRADLLPMYKDLTGYGSMKPFECVGEFEEVIAALALIDGRGEYTKSPIIQWFASEVATTRKDIDHLIDTALTLSPDHSMPEEFVSMVYDSR